MASFYRVLTEKIIKAVPYLWGELVGGGSFYWYPNKVVLALGRGREEIRTPWLAINVDFTGGVRIDDSYYWWYGWGSGVIWLASSWGSDTFFLKIPQTEECIRRVVGIKASDLIDKIENVKLGRVLGGEFYILNCSKICPEYGGASCVGIRIRGTVIANWVKAFSYYRISPIDIVYSLKKAIVDKYRFGEVGEDYFRLVFANSITTPESWKNPKDHKVVIAPHIATPVPILGKYGDVVVGWSSVADYISLRGAILSGRLIFTASSAGNVLKNIWKQGVSGISIYAKLKDVVFPLKISAGKETTNLKILGEMQDTVSFSLEPVEWEEAPCCSLVVDEDDFINSCSEIENYWRGRQLYFETKDNRFMEILPKIGEKFYMDITFTKPDELVSDNNLKSIVLTIVDIYTPTNLLLDGKEVELPHCLYSNIPYLYRFVEKLLKSGIIDDRVKVEIRYSYTQKSPQGAWRFLIKDSVCGGADGLALYTPKDISLEASVLSQEAYNILTNIHRPYPLTPPLYYGYPDGFVKKILIGTVEQAEKHHQGIVVKKVSSFKV